MVISITDHESMSFKARWGDHTVACRLCTHYIDDLVPYAPLELCSYWGCGQVFHN